MSTHSSAPVSTRNDTLVWSMPKRGKMRRPSTKGRPDVLPNLPAIGIASLEYHGPLITVDIPRYDILPRKLTSVRAREKFGKRIRACHHLAVVDCHPLLLILIYEAKMLRRKQLRGPAEALEIAVHVFRISDHFEQLLVIVNHWRHIDFRSASRAKISRTIYGLNIRCQRLESLARGSRQLPKTASTRC